MLHWIIVPKSDFRNILIFYEIEPCTHCHTIIYLPSAYDYIYRPSFISRIKACHCLSVLLWGMVHAFLKSLSTYNLNLILKKDFKLDVIFVKKILSTYLLTKLIPRNRPARSTSWHFNCLEPRSNQSQHKTNGAMVHTNSSVNHLILYDIITLLANIHRWRGFGQV